jgi:hypothetical protein
MLKFMFSRILHKAWEERRKGKKTIEMNQRPSDRGIHGAIAFV